MCPNCVQDKVPQQISAQVLFKQTLSSLEFVFPSLIKKTLLAYFTNFPIYAGMSMPDAQITADAFWDSMSPWIHHVHLPCCVAACHHWSYHWKHHSSCHSCCWRAILLPGGPCIQGSFRSPWHPWRVLPRQWFITAMLGSPIFTYHASLR